MKKAAIIALFLAAGILIPHQKMRADEDNPFIKLYKAQVEVAIANQERWEKSHEILVKIRKRAEDLYQRGSGSLEALQLAQREEVVAAAYAKTSKARVKGTEALRDIIQQKIDSGKVDLKDIPIFPVGATE